MGTHERGGRAFIVRERPVPIPLMSDADCDDCDCINFNRGGRGLCCGLVTFLVSIVLFALSWDTVAPTEYGLVQNGFTGYVELSPDWAHESGRYFIWLRHSFLTFPRNLVNLEFSERGGDRLPIPARTGPDPDDKESGGQPIEISVSFQYQLNKRDVPLVYKTFGFNWESSYMRFAQQAITNKAQDFTPRMFWTRRKYIESELHKAVNATLFRSGYASVITLQLLKVSFNSDYEDTITNIQLQEQLKVTKGYQLEVTRVLKEVDILQAETDAQIAKINAQAKREADVIVNEANAQALRLEQSTKAFWYQQLKSELGWSTEDFLKYVKIKSINKQEMDHVVVGVQGLA